MIIKTDNKNYKSGQLHCYKVVGLFIPADNFLPCKRRNPSRYLIVSATVQYKPDLQMVAARVPQSSAFLHHKASFAEGAGDFSSGKSTGKLPRTELKIQLEEEKNKED